MKNIFQIIYTVSINSYFFSCYQVLFIKKESSGTLLSQEYYSDKFNKLFNLGSSLVSIKNYI